MEGVGLIITRGLAGLIIPVSLVAIPLALVLVWNSLSRRPLEQSCMVSPSASATSRPRDGSSALEIISVTICFVVAMIGAIAFAMNVIEGDPIHPSQFVAVLGLWLLIISPGLLWRSPWRSLAEGLATIALAVVTVLTGFSIGFALLPLLIAMMVVCFQRIRTDTVRA